MDVNQAKYGYIKVVGFTTNQQNHCCIIMILKFTQHEMKENMLQKFLSQIWRRKSTNILIKYQKLYKLTSKYNNTYHRTVKVEIIDVKSGSYIDFDAESNDKDPTFKVGDHARISKWKNILAKGYTTNLSEEIFVIRKVKNTIQWMY